MEGATAVADDYVQDEKDCSCMPADPKMQCDAKYGGWWTMKPDGKACGTKDDGATSLLATAALAIGTVLLF